MIGSGVFLLPRRFGTETGVLGAIIAWTIAGAGMLMLAFVFQRLAMRKPDLDAGIFAYAKAGFGDYVGFNSAIGYWASACAGNTSYWVLITATMSAIFPAFGAGDTVLAVVVSLIGVWSFCYLVSRGVKDAAVINYIVTDRQGRADPDVHRDRDHRLQGRRVRRQLLGWVGVLVLVDMGPSDRHDADHGVRVPGNRGRQRLFPDGPQARRRRSRDGHRIPQCSQCFRDGDGGVLRRDAAGRTGRDKPAFDGRRPGIHRWAVGVDLHPRRRDRLGAGCLPRMDADGCRGALHSRDHRRHAAVSGAHQPSRRAAAGVGHGRGV